MALALLCSGGGGSIEQTNSGNPGRGGGIGARRMVVDDPTWVAHVHSGAGFPRPRHGHLRQHADGGGFGGDYLRKQTGVLLALRPNVSMARANTCHYCPAWLTGLVLSLGVLALLFAGGCRRGVPVVDLGPKPPAARGTITGIVRGPEGTSPLSGRTVEVINTATGERRTVQTAANGGFTIELPAGKYRL